MKNERMERFLGGLQKLKEGSEVRESFSKGGSVKDQARLLAGMGRCGDTELVHVNKAEERMLKAMGGRGFINPKTGLREYMTCPHGSSGRCFECFKEEYKIRPKDFFRQPTAPKEQESQKKTDIPLATKEEILLLKDNNKHIMKKDGVYKLKGSQIANDCQK